MRAFHVLAYDGTIDGTTSVYIDAGLNDQLGTADQLRLAAVTDAVSGTSPTLTVQVEHSGDNLNWLSRFGTPEINAVALSTTAPTTTLANAASSALPAAFVRLRIQLGGTSPRAHVRVWATGRAERSARRPDERQVP